jgi:hypothetical protein
LRENGFEEGAFLKKITAGIRGKNFQMGRGAPEYLLEFAGKGAL